MSIPEFILAMSVSLVFGMSIGRILGHWDYKPIIEAYKNAIEGYKRIIYQERENKEEIIAEYKKVIEILKKHDLG